MTESPESLRQLRRRREFLHVASKGDRRASPGLVLQACPREDASDIGLGLTASKKVGNAVARNRARRRLRSLARELLPVCATPGYDYVLIARGATVTRPYARLREDLKGALRRLKLLRQQDRAS
jgi:ribonuclease P protein component